MLNDAANNRVETVAADLEGTLTAGVSWQGMRDFLFEQGQEQRYKRFFLRKMPRYGLHRLGLISRQSLKENWILDQLRLFAGYTAKEMVQMSSFVVEQCLWPGRRQPVVDELLNHRQKGRRVIINTGLVEPILEQLLPKLDGFAGIGTPLRFDDGIFTGEIAAPLNVGQRKAEQLQPFLHDGPIVAAYGDTAADLPMMLLSQSPVAVYPDSELQRRAEREGWRILAGDAS